MEKKRALEGVRIADFSWLLVGPTMTKFAANFGAEVIRIESHTRADMARTSGPYRNWEPGINRSAMFTLFNDGKWGISLNMSMPQAREVARKLIYDWANVVTHAFLPGVMEKWGLDYESLREKKPDLIYIATSLQGETGPHSKLPGHGMVGSHLAGFSYLSGWPDREPANPPGAYTDVTAFPHVFTALVAALIHRRRTGKGQYVDASQLEASLPFLASPVMDYMVNRRVMMRMGNRSTNAAPHAIYRCLGDERWCAIAVGTDEEWRNFCRVIGDPEWTKDSRFSKLGGRKENEDELNALVEKWTAIQEPEDVMRLMQAAGVPAGVVARAQDLVADPQLNHRGTHVILEHPEIGRHIYQPPPYRLSKTPSELAMPAPCLGQHNEYILKEVLGMSDDEVAELLIAGALE